MRASCASPNLEQALVPRRHYASEKSKPQEDDDDESDKKPGGKPDVDFNVTPWTRFLALPYRKKKVVRTSLSYHLKALTHAQNIIHRFKRWWNRLSRFGIDEQEFLDGAKQAFHTISPFLVYGSPLPSLVEMRSMLEPELVRSAWRSKQTPSNMIPALVELVEADVLTVEVKPVSPFERLLDEVKDDQAPKGIDGIKLALNVAVRFHTKEELKIFGGIPQMSPTRFFDMEHVWIFKRRLPPQKLLQELKASGEEIPASPWRLAKPMAFYPAHVQIDLRGRRKRKEDDDDEEEEN